MKTIHLAALILAPGILNAQHTTDAATPAGKANLAQQLANPVAQLISVPIQGNVDFGVGPGDGTRSVTNIQPVIPFELSEHWNLISRSILPVIDQEGIDLAGATDEFGLGDTVQIFFISPKSSNPIWGLGPVLLIPTATDSILGSEKWEAGPTGVVLKQSGSWTYGALANHIWSYAGDDARTDVNATFIQPFVSYITDTKTTQSLTLESTYDWDANQWNIPANFVVSQLLKIGDQPVQLLGGIRYYLDGPDGGPEWGLRFGVTFLFPKS